MARRALMAGSGALAVVGALALGAHPALASTSRTVAVGSSQAALTIGTVPELPGVRVILDGVTHFTNSEGMVTIATFAGRHQIEIKPPSKREADTGVRFNRWLDGIALASRTLYLHQGANREEAGFALSYPISVRFATKAGRSLPMSSVSSVTIANSLGARFTFTPSDPPSLLAANRIVRARSGLYLQPIRYSIRTVLYGGANVVYAGSQNFFVHPNRVWTIKLLLFTMRLEVRDALFGFPIGSAVRIRVPHRPSRVVKLGAGHAITLPNMPRSTYDLVAKGPGFGLSAPATLTKPLTAKLLLLSWVDISAVVAFFVLFILGLPLLGGRIIRRKGRRVRLLAWHAGHPDQAVAPAGATAPAADLALNTIDPVPAVADPAPLAVFGGDPVALPAKFAASPAQEPIAGGDNKAPALGAPPEQDDVTEILPAIVASAPDAVTGPDPEEPGRRA